MNKNNYFETLSREFHNNSEEIITELINLEAILNLPKGTEFYLSDIHGEYDAFEHILRTGAGNIKEKVSKKFKNQLSKEEINHLSLLIAYPKEFLEQSDSSADKTDEWYQKIIVQLIEMLSYSSSKYTRSKVRKALPQKYLYVVEELLYTDISFIEKESYYEEIIRKLISLNQAQNFIIAVTKSIRQLAIDHLHIVGDIFDRGSDADKVMENIVNFHSVDIQWGNHDMLWIGAFAGSKACLITLLRIATRYNYLYELERSYALNLRPLFLFANRIYKNNPHFTPNIRKKRDDFSTEDINILEKVHQALTIIQFKLEGQIIQRRPNFAMQDRLLLDKIDWKNNTIELGQNGYKIKGACFQTINPLDPYTLTSEEEYVVKSLLISFQQSDKIKKHINFLLDNGSMYSVYNKQLLFHGCIPLTELGNFMEMTLLDGTYSGKALLEQFEFHIRMSCKNQEITDDFHTDLIWYSWIGKKSPLFGRSRMTTFERYFIENNQTHQENDNPYYRLRDNEGICLKILEEFGLSDENSHIINGHTPVKVKKGESPLKANNRLFVIDGGLSKAYQAETGIAGYSLLNNSYGFQLVTHQPFSSIDALFLDKEDRISLKKVIDTPKKRVLIRETTIGTKIKEQSDVLQKLLLYVQKNVKHFEHMD
ncbi:MAG: fructose-1,6-bisphosphatase [Streptococcaceae bacterium]|jgi:fructose-1,6-bisphosphatase-3|nr:fructose-1,6-bisphosphatase [Streptococcaceae bacterium]